MDNKLTEIAIKNSFERYVYSNFSRITLYVLNILSGLILINFMSYDLEELKKGFRLTHFVSLGLWVIVMAVMVLLANHSTKKSLGCTVFSKNRGKIFRKKMKKRVRKLFFSKNGKLSKMEIEEAISKLEAIKESIRSEFRKISIVSGSVIGVVWIHFIGSLFNLTEINNDLLKLIYLFVGLTVLCVLIIGMYFLVRSFLLMSSKIAKIESFVSILNEVEYDSRDESSST